MFRWKTYGEPPSGYRRDYGNETQGDRLLAGVAQSRRRAVGLPRRGASRARTSRLRRRGAREAPGSWRTGRASTRSASPTSTSTTGATSSRGSGRSGSAPPPSSRGRTCGCRRAARSSERDRRAAGDPGHVPPGLHIKEYVEGEDFETGGFRITPRRVLHYELLAFGFRVSCNGKTRAYSGDSGPSDELAGLAATPTSSSARPRCSTRTPRAVLVGTSPPTRLTSVQASGAKRLLLTHRPKERPLEPEFEQVHDGFETEI